MESKPTTEEQVFTYLDELREFGKVNIQFATLYIVQKFPVDYNEASKLLKLWADRRERVNKDK